MGNQERRPELQDYGISRKQYFAYIGKISRNPNCGHTWGMPIIAIIVALTVFFFVTQGVSELVLGLGFVALVAIVTMYGTFIELLKRPLLLRGDVIDRIKLFEDANRAYELKDCETEEWD